ncbi:MAG: TlyA family RNA methyltransferase [Polyangiaceae bacterium]|nr:TlyA family RNA methyltransferase [Polyangiaceae bacterium]
MKIRADQLLVDQGLAPSRAKAQAMIMAGQAYAGDQRLEKAGQSLPSDMKLRLIGVQRFVSRGGDKLLSAIETMGLDPSGKICVDVGASTGGFTDCLLQHGASKVYAVDVGRGQLNPKISQDERVVVMDGTNARLLEADHFDYPIDWVVVDASFISLDKLLGPIASFIEPDGQLLAMVKPQFEAGREIASRYKGVIPVGPVRDEILANTRELFSKAGFEIIAEADSKIAGPKGNVERFMHCRR